MIPTTSGATTAPGTSNAFRHHAAERTWGKHSVANADVMATEPSPKKIAGHNTGSISGAE